jgi:hypothetical protein
MRYLPLLAVASLAVLGACSLAACSPKVEVTHKDHKLTGKREPLRAISKLDCPDKQGELTRVSAAADGQACVYAGQNAEVTLSLVALNGGDAEAALAPIEADLKTLMPAMKAPPTPPTPGGKPRGESAKISLPGIKIDAHDKGADIKIGGLTINANDDGAEVGWPRTSRSATAAPSSMSPNAPAAAIRTSASSPATTTKATPRSTPPTTAPRSASAGAATACAPP